MSKSKKKGNKSTAPKLRSNEGGIKPLYKTDAYFGILMATLPNGGQVSTCGKVFTPRGVEVHEIPYPFRVEVIPLIWTSRVETRTTEIQCNKMEGHYERVHSGGTRPSLDGYRSGSEGTWSNQFIRDRYLVEVTYSVLIMTSNEGEEAVFSPDMPNPDMLGVWTGYGKQGHYTVDKVPPVPPMPSERVIKHHVTLEEKLQYYYDSAMKYFEDSPLPVVEEGSWI